MPEAVKTVIQDTPEKFRSLAEGISPHQLTLEEESLWEEYRRREEWSVEHAL